MGFVVLFDDCGMVFLGLSRSARSSGCAIVAAMGLDSRVDILVDSERALRSLEMALSLSLAFLLRSTGMDSKVVHITCGCGRANLKERRSKFGSAISAMPQWSLFLAPKVGP